MTLTIGKRVFVVTQERLHEGRPVYELRGPRGAHYFTMRNHWKPELMFLCNGRRCGLAKGLAEGVWLTDKNGKLEVA